MPESQLTRTTRLAPSPTGALHLGNVFAFLITWAIARSQGMRLIMRIEDLDGPRIKPEMVDQTIGLLRTLGMEWDGPTVIQSTLGAAHRQAMAHLAESAVVYPCELTRRQIEQAAGAPHADDEAGVFPTSLRPSALVATDFDDELTNWRLIVEERPITIDDQLAGERTFDLSKTIGDFVVWTRRGQPSYQLAVVVDDHEAGVTDVIRGADLLESAARQTHLMDQLGIISKPVYWHVPLIQGSDGRRLAKRHGDTRVASYLERGVDPERIIGLVGYWCNLRLGREPMRAEEFLDEFDRFRLPRSPITFTDEDDRWLTDE